MHDKIVVHYTLRVKLCVWQSKKKTNKNYDVNPKVGQTFEVHFIIR